MGKVLPYIFNMSSNIRNTFWYNNTQLSVSAFHWEFTIILDNNVVIITKNNKAINYIYRKFLAIEPFRQWFIIRSLVFLLKTLCCWHSASKANASCWGAIDEAYHNSNTRVMFSWEASNWAWYSWAVVAARG